MIRKMFIMMFVIALTGPSGYADDVAIDSNGNVTTGVSNPNANLEVTGASGEDAIMGSASGTGAAGVYGINADNGNYGILGYAHGAADFGVYGYSLDYGVYGTSPGYAGYFEGDAVVTGTLTVGTLLGYTENDPQVGSLTAGMWCTSDGTQVNCSSSAPVTGETDPIFGSSPASGITSGLITNWNTAYSWGDHSAAGYLLNETDPQVGGITTNYVPMWNGSALVTGSIYDNGFSIGIGTTFPLYNKVEVLGNVLVNGWLKTGGNYGWVNEYHGGGWYMNDSSFIRAYNDKSIYTGGQVLASTVSANTVDGTGVYGIATGTGTGGYFTSGSGYGLIVENGDVGIGTTNPTHKLDVNGNLRIENRFRSGAETGTSQGPGYPDQGGMIVRRISSTSAINGGVVAATDTISFQRDGTNGGFKAVVTGSHNTIMCSGVDGSGTNVNSLNSAVLTGTYTVYTNAQNVVYMSCSFGSPYLNLHTTQLTLFRESGDYFWNGFIMSTYDQ